MHMFTGIYTAKSFAYQTSTAAYLSLGLKLQSTQSPFIQESLSSETLQRTELRTDFFQAHSFADGHINNGCSLAK